MTSAKSYQLSEIAQLLDVEMKGDPACIITGVRDLASAGCSDASFLANMRYKEAMLSSQAGVICLRPEEFPNDQRNYLLCSSPSKSFQQLVELFLGRDEGSGFDEIHPTAVIHPSCQLGRGVRIGPYVVIDQGVKIGDQTQIGAHTSIGHQVEIGSHCTIHSHVTIRERCKLGHRVIVQPGAVIGSCGFGFIMGPDGRYEKLEQLGIVEIEDEVEVGACTTIDRARFGMTRIGRGTKLDNLVQIAHNVELGPHNIIVSQTGIAGSSKTGSYVVMGGQTGVVGHVEIADRVMIASRGGVSKSLTKPGEKYSGAPVLPLGEYNRQQVYLRKIAYYVKKLEELEETIQQLQES